MDSKPGPRTCDARTVTTHNPLLTLLVQRWKQPSEQSAKREQLCAVGEVSCSLCWVGSSAPSLCCAALTVLSRKLPGSEAERGSLPWASRLQVSISFSVLSNVASPLHWLRRAQGVRTYSYKSKGWCVFFSCMQGENLENVLNPGGNF